MCRLFRTYSVVFALLITIVSAGAQTTEEFLTGRFDPDTCMQFIKIDTAYCENDSMYIQTAVYRAFLRMYYAALDEGIKLRIVSATRSFKRQRSIWETKWNALQYDGITKCREILKYSSMPGTSRHHWGTDIDLCSTENYDWRTPEYQRILKWLKLNAPRFGFYMPYNHSYYRTGYKYEPWHWSYYLFADEYTDALAELIPDSKISGFSGAELAPQLRIVQTYVLGVKNPPHFRMRPMTVPYVEDYY